MRFRKVHILNWFLNFEGREKYRKKISKKIIFNLEEYLQVILYSMQSEYTPFHQLSVLIFLSVLDIVCCANNTKVVLEKD